MLKSIKYKSQTTANTYDNGVLKNKFEIKEEHKLHKVEEAIVLSLITHIFNEGFTGEFDKKHLLSIHKYLFGKIYYFAGEIRNENIIKGETLFCQFYLIDEELEKLLYKLSKEQINSKEELVKVISNYYSELNIIHPFREGNGRTIRIFLKLFARSLGYDINFELVSRDDLLEATIYSVSHDNSKLEKIFEKIIERNT